MNRRYPTHPVLGVGALIFEDNKVLLIERGKEPLKGYWSLPGGAVETGERLEDAVRRELLEETGLHVNPLYMAEVFERIMPDSAGGAEYHYVLLDYVCGVTGGRLCASSDASRVEWVSMQVLPDLLLTSGTKDVIERAYADYQRRNS